MQEFNPECIILEFAESFSNMLMSDIWNIKFCPTKQNSLEQEVGIQRQFLIIPGDLYLHLPSTLGHHMLLNP